MGMVYFLPGYGCTIELEQGLVGPICHVFYHILNAIFGMDGDWPMHGGTDMYFCFCYLHFSYVVVGTVFSGSFQVDLLSYWHCCGTMASKVETRS
jgi:hypothetical protein